MDDESIGLFGVLLLITAVFLAHPFQVSRMPAFPHVHWEDVVEAACSSGSADECGRLMLEH